MPLVAPRRGRPSQAVIPETAPSPSPAPAAPEPPAPVQEARPAKLFKARRVPIHHPYQNVLIPVGTGVPLLLDNWVEVQLAAKVIEPA